MWAKIVNDEIMQLHDEDPTGLWHPEQIEKNDLPGHWEQVPDECHIGWKLKDGRWISGGQWLEEYIAENPPPLPGPPGCNINLTDAKSTFEKTILELRAVHSGIVESIQWEIEGKTYTEEALEVEFDCNDTAYNIVVNLTVTGPGGEATDSRTYIVPALFVPPPVGLLDR